MPMAWLSQQILLKQILRSGETIMMSRRDMEMKVHYRKSFRYIQK